MIDIIVAFANWFWTSGVGTILFLIGIIPMLTWQIVKRLPNKKRRKIRRIGKKNGRR